MIELSDPDHVTADFVGEPGQRTFYLQASERGELVSVLVEKQQVAALAEALVQLLDEVGVVPPDLWEIPEMRLREPIASSWRGGQISVGIDPALGRFVLDVEEAVADEREADRLRVWFDETLAARLAAHAVWAVEQGRPACELCGLPRDADGHVCPRSNGDPQAR